jgi:hypothetical protein
VNSLIQTVNLQFGPVNKWQLGRRKSTLGLFVNDSRGCHNPRRRLVIKDVCVILSLRAGGIRHS